MCSRHSSSIAQEGHHEHPSHHLPGVLGHPHRHSSNSHHLPLLAQEEA